MGILGIETSCDETSVAFVEEGRVVRQLIASQVEAHRPYHGVVPELASRHHLQNLPVLMRELGRAVDLRKVEAVAVTQGPGLVGALLVGVAFAKGFAAARRLPLVPVNHIEAHLYSPFIGRSVPADFLGLVVSGSHASLYRVRRGRLQRLARTRDDAPGEAYDKVAKLFGLPYPGGPEIDRLYPQGDPGAFDLPLPKMSDGSLDLSFSGLKSHIAYRFHKGFRPRRRGRLTPQALDLLASFQSAVVRHLLHRVEALHRLHPVRHLSVSGGVAANAHLRERTLAWASGRGVEAHFPPTDYITDNAGMVAHLAWRRGKARPPAEVDADPGLELN
jgi:N6-L-threonylcarbamoyladenine synthase